jgi:hypothetical protein
MINDGPSVYPAEMPERPKGKGLLSKSRKLAAGGDFLANNPPRQVEENKNGEASVLEYQNQFRAPDHQPVNQGFG